MPPGCGGPVGLPAAISLGVGLLSFVLIYAGALGYKSFGHPEDHGHEDEPTFTPVEPAAAGSGGASAEAEVSHQQWAGDVLYYKEHILRHDADAARHDLTRPSMARPCLADRSDGSGQ